MSCRARWLNRLQFLVFFSISVAFFTPTMAFAQTPRNSDQKVFDQKMADRLKKVLESSPEEGFVLETLLTMYRSFKSADELIAEYEEKSLQDPDKLSFQLIVGFLYKAEGKLQKAKERFEIAKNLAPNASAARLAMASLLEETKEFDKAFALYEETLGTLRDKILTRKILRKLVSLSIEIDNISKAKEFAKKLRKTDPSNLYLALEFPESLVRAEFFEEAIVELRALLRAAHDGKTKVSILQSLGAAYEAKEDHKNALDSYEKALAMTLRGNSARAELRERIVGVYRKNDDVRTYISVLEKEGRKGFEEWELLGRLYEEVSNNPGAIEALLKASKLSPKRLSVRERLIRIYQRIGKFDEMIKQYRALIKVAPQDPRWPIALAELLEKRGQSQEALKILVDMRKRYASDPSIRLSLADLYSRFGKRDLVLKEYEALVRLEPKEPSHIIALGEAYWQLERKEEAQRAWKKLLDLIPEEAKAYAVYANQLGQHDLFSLAVDAYQKAIEKDEKNLSYQKELALLFERYKKPREAILVWKGIIKTPTAKRDLLREAREHTVELYNDINELSTQLVLAKKAFQKDPPDLEKGAFLALAYLRLGQEKEALAVLEELAKKDPKNPEYLHDLAEIYERTQSLEKAIAVLKKLVEIEPFNAREYYQKISENLNRLRKDDESIVFAQKALALNPTDASGYAKLGKVFHDQFKFEEATKAYEKALSLNRRAFTHYFTLAKLYETQQRIPEAEALLREVSTRSLDDAEIQKAAELILEIAQADSLEKLERDLLTLFHAPPSRPVYRRVLIDVYQEMTNPLIASLHSPLKTEREQAKKQLEEIGKRALFVLSQALTDSDGEQKREALRLVGYLQNPNGVLTLATLLEDTDEEYQILAAISLGRLKDKSAVSALGRALQSSLSHERVKVAAAWALGEIQSPNVVTYLAKKKGVGLDDSKEAVRVVSALSLAKQQDLSAVPELLLHLRDSDERNSNVRMSAAYALGILKAPSAKKALLEQLLYDSSANVRRACALALGLIKDEGSIESLLTVLWDPDHLVSMSAESAIAMFTQTNDVVMTHFQKQDLSYYFLKDPKTPEDFFTINPYLENLLSIASAPITGGANTLILQHKDALKDSMALALSQKKKQERVLIYLNESESEFGRSDGRLSLGSLFDAHGEKNQEIAALLQEVVIEATPKLLDLLKDRDPKTIRLAASILGKARINEAVDPLSAMLFHPETTRDLLVQPIAIALARIGTKEAFAALKKASSSTRLFVRLAVAQAWGATKDAKRESDLLPLLEDTELLIQQAAFDSLAEIKGATSLSYRISELASKERSNLLRQSVASALAYSSDPRAEGLLINLSSDPDPKVAQRAKNALQIRKKP